MKKQRLIEPGPNGIGAIEVSKPTARSWPRNLVESVQTRKRDLVVRIADWSRQSRETGEPAYDVEVYHKGTYDWNLSKTFCLREMSKADAKRAAAKYAGEI